MKIGGAILRILRILQFQSSQDFCIPRIVTLSLPQTVTNSEKDPCLDAEEFPDLYLGSRNEKCPTPHTGHQQCDYSLPDDRWYKISNASLLNSPPSGNCGVVYAVWMNGEFVL